MAAHAPPNAQPSTTNPDIAQALVQAFDHLQVRPKQEPQKYTGKENPEYFLHSFRLATRNLPEADKKAVFRLSMTGPAYTWLCVQGLADEKRGIEASMADWEERLKSAFGRNETASLDELEGRRLGPNESAADYVRDVIRLCSEVDPSMSQAFIIRHLHRGVGERYSRDMLVMDPQTTLEFQSKLNKLMTVAPSSASTDRALISSLLAQLVKQPPAPALVASAAAPPEADQTKQLLQRLEAIEKRLRQPRRDFSKVVCFNCNKVGHVKRQCKAPPCLALPVAENENARS